LPIFAQAGQVGSNNARTRRTAPHLRSAAMPGNSMLWTSQAAVMEPAIDAEDRRTRGTRRARGGLLARLLRYGVVALGVLVALPIALTLLYAVPFVRPVSNLMAVDLVMLRGYDRQWTGLDDMGDAIVHSVMMSEDGRFCSHGGVDWGAMHLVIEEILSGEGSRGASTIPMQTVKNLFLWHGRSYVRKGLEVPLAVWFDLVLSKRRVMEIYLNIAEWGPNVYGAEAAAQHHFGRSAKNLTARQAALLAITLPSPRTRNPAKPTPAMNRLAGIVQARADQAGDYVTCLE
jgi:monofunctional biosynthetic peptidoglycan transglycosylase